VLTPVLLAQVSLGHPAASGPILSWLASLAVLAALAPVWTALDRFIILKEANRPYLRADLRLRRVLLATLALSLISFLGSFSLVIGTILMGHAAGRRLIILAIMVAAALVRVAAWWLGARLAIAPPLAAAGVRPRALDTAYSYTQGAVWRIMLARSLVYLPLFLFAGGIFLIVTFAPWRLAGPAMQLGQAVLTTALSALTELLDAATMALIAVRLVRGRKATTLAEAAETVRA
jgi:hypothetical protein